MGPGNYFLTVVVFLDLAGRFLPCEPLQILPFLDFTSPFPMNINDLYSQQK